MRIYIFLGGMWVLIILGGGLAVTILGPLDLGEEHGWLNAPLKGGVAILMVILWVVILVRMKRYLLR